VATGGFQSAVRVVRDPSRSAGKVEPKRGASPNSVKPRRRCAEGATRRCDLELARIRAAAKGRAIETFPAPATASEESVQRAVAKGIRPEPLRGRASPFGGALRSVAGQGTRLEQTHGRPEPSWESIGRAQAKRNRLELQHGKQHLFGGAAGRAAGKGTAWNRCTEGRSPLWRESAGRAEAKGNRPESLFGRSDPSRPEGPNPRESRGDGNIAASHGSARPTSRG
jgi:hypothetical protein